MSSQWRINTPMATDIDSHDWAYISNNPNLNSSFNDFAHSMCAIITKKNTTKVKIKAKNHKQNP